MAKSIHEMRKKIKPEAQAAARAKAVGIIAEMTLAEARKERGQSQYVDALGGKLEIHAKFPDGQDVKIVQFER